MTMLWGRKRRIIDALERRVRELENIICPLKSHEWACTGRDEVMIGGYIESIYEYTCVKCGRVEYDYLEPVVKLRRANDAIE